MNLRKTEDVLNDIKSLIYSKGYIYALCMILFEDFHFILKDIHKADFSSRLSKNEASLLIGFLIQKEINFSFPDNLFDILKLKEITYELMQELHESLQIPINEKAINILKEQKGIDLNAKMKPIYGDDHMFIEPIFYANDGVYSFQYMDFLEKKYIYD